MCSNLVTKVRRVPTTFAFVVLIAAVCMVSVACSGQKAESDKATATDVMPLAARVDRLDGEVGVDRQTDAQDNSQNQSNKDWGKASVNSPVSVGSRVYVKDNSHAAIAFSGRNYARLNPRTSLDVLSLSQRRTQLALRDGSGIFDVGALAPDELFEVATPNGAVDFQQPGLYQVGIDDGGNTLVSVLSGIAQVVGLGGSGQVGRGQLLTFGGGEGSEAYVSELDSGVCGSIANDYYSYRYPTTYDGRYSDYQRYQDDRYYDDPYRRSASYQYIPDDAEVAGLDDLDDYGDWEDVSGQGHCWRPRVSSDWAPYRDGSWYDDQPLGLTWVSSERWGWAPYHYGRWTKVSQRWYWVPGEIVSRPVYAPALVAFVPFTQEDRVGWVALGPGDPYVPRYYDRNYQPHYIGSTTYITKNVNVTSIVNYNVPGAVTVVRTTEFSQVVTPRNSLRADQSLLARSRPVLDPYSDQRLRDLAPDIRTHGPRIQLDNRADQALNRSVVTSREPIVPAVAANTPRGLKNKSVTEAEGKHKLQINNTGQTVTAIHPNGLPVLSGGQNQTMTPQERQARIDALTAQVGKGDKSAKRELRQLRDQQGAQEKVDRHAAPQATVIQQGQQQQQKQEQKAARKAAAQQQSPVQQQQLKQEQKAARKAAQEQQQPPVQQQQQQKQEQKAARKAAQEQPPVQQQQQKQQQQKAERKAAQQQADQQQQQQKQQQKAERKAAQQQQQQQPAQPPQQKPERKAAPQQQADQQQQQQQKEQQKAQRKAAQQQQQQQPAQQPAQPPQPKAERKAAQQQPQQQPAQPPQPKAERKAAQQQADQQQQQKQQQKAERKAAPPQPPEQPSPSKAERKAEKAKNKNGNNNGNPNQ